MIIISFDSLRSLRTIRLCNGYLYSRYYNRERVVNKTNQELNRLRGRESNPLPQDYEPCVQPLHFPACKHIIAYLRNSFNQPNQLGNLSLLFPSEAPRTC